MNDFNSHILCALTLLLLTKVRGLPLPAAV